MANKTDILGVRKPLKHPREMQAGEINRELESLRKKRAKNTEAFIKAGRGEERSDDFLTKTDPLSSEAKALHDRFMLLQNEVDRRMGPGLNLRLPRGFGPIRL